MIDFIDLFAGTGAFSFVLESTGLFRCVFSNDIEKNSKAIYDINHKSNKLVLKDLITIEPKDIPHHSLLCGGFPCQPFSIAGEQRGFEDDRSNVFWKILDILKFHKTDMFILENVKNLQSHDKGRTFNIIIENLKKLGYFIKFSILDTSKITSVSQHRERIYIVGFLDKKKYDLFNLEFPPMTCRPVYDFLVKDIPNKYYYDDRYTVYDQVRNGVTKNISTGTVYQFRRYYVRENKSGYCPTLTANMGSGGHNVPIILENNGIRKLTPRECFNLQGFPPDYKLPSLCDSALYKLAGNAVSVPVVQLIAVKLIQLLS